MGKFPVIDKCLGCREIDVDGTCKGYTFPEALWRRGTCPRATNLKKTIKPDMKLNPLKASKRKMKEV